MLVLLFSSSSSLLGRSLLLLTWLIVPKIVNAQFQQQQQQQLCQICPLGEPIIREGNRPLMIPGRNNVRDCLSMETSVSIFPVLEGSELCDLYQKHAFYCGCAVPPTGCRMCGTNTSFVVQEPDRSLRLFDSFLDGAMRITTTCELMESALYTINQDEEQCGQFQTATAEYCDCKVGEGRLEIDVSDPTYEGGLNDTTAVVPPPEYPPEDDDTKNSSATPEPCQLCGGPFPVNDDKSLSLGILPIDSCGWLQQALEFLFVEGQPVCVAYQNFASLCGCPVREDACPLCQDGSPVPHLNKTLPFGNYNDNSSSGGDDDDDDDDNGDRELPFTMTCELFEALTANTLSTPNETCRQRQFLGGIYCGCAPPQTFAEDPCPFCIGAPVTNSKKELSFLQEELGFSPTCEYLEVLQPWIPKNSPLCAYVELSNYHCGCSLQPTILGANTRAEELGLAWARRVASIVSILCSVSVIAHSLCCGERRSKLYYQLVFRMAVFDLIFAASWLLFRRSSPEEMDGSDEDRCVAHSFFIQSWIPSAFCKATLLAYYALVLVFGYKEEILKTVRFWIRGIPISSSLAILCSGIRFYEIIPFGCYINRLEVNPPKAAPVVVFMVVPVVVSISVGVVSVLLIAAQKCRSSTEKSASDEDSNQSHLKADSAATRQAILYLLVLVFTYPVLVVGVAKYADLNDRSYGFWVLILIIGPMHGIGNSVVYFVPPLQRYLQNKGWIGRTNKRGQTSPLRNRRGEEGYPIEAGEAAISKGCAIVPELNEDDENHFVDPSVAIAISRPAVAYQQGLSLEQEPQFICMDEGLYQHTHHTQASPTTVDLPAEPSTLSFAVETDDVVAVEEYYEQESLSQQQEYYHHHQHQQAESRTPSEPFIVVEEVDENDVHDLDVAFAVADNEPPAESTMIDAIEPSTPKDEAAYTVAESLETVEENLIQKGLNQESRERITSGKQALKADSLSLDNSEESLRTKSAILEKDTDSKGS